MSTSRREMYTDDPFKTPNVRAGQAFYLHTCKSARFFWRALPGDEAILVHSIVLSEE